MGLLETEKGERSGEGRRRKVCKKWTQIYPKLCQFKDCISYNSWPIGDDR